MKETWVVLDAFMNPEVIFCFSWQVFSATSVLLMVVFCFLAFVSSLFGQFVSLV